MKRTPLRRDTPKSIAWNRKPRKPLPRKSAKQRDIDRERAKIKTKLLVAAGATHPDVPISVVCGARNLVPGVTCASPFESRPRLEVHEIVKRSRWSAGALVPSNCVLLCQAHHDWTEKHPDGATAVGLLARAPRVER